jgi:D-lyxose ketol-isomerase
VKRSEINGIMREGARFLKRMNFFLPPFAWWTPGDWARRGPESSDIVRQQLGWDITDFGSGEFGKVGLFVFTIRNGTYEELKKELGRTYAEKILIVEEDQITPTHFHYQKMEDIINRGGGDLVIQLWNSTIDEGLAKSPVDVVTDGVHRFVDPGATVTLVPGESISIPQRLYHKFWGKKGSGTVLVGEVSRVNDDQVDNRFFDPVGRFPDIEEDVQPLYLLYNDYLRYYHP